MRIFPIYFSCGRDQKMLELSIESLRRNGISDTIFVASDSRDPVFINAENVSVIKKKSSSEKLYGKDNIREMHSIFGSLSEKMSEQDYLMKIDSDIICCSGKVFKRLREGGWDCYGCFPMAIPEMIPERHFNGNVYFLKKWVGSSLPKIDWDDGVEDWSWMNYPEDMVTSHLCNRITDKIQIDYTAQSGGGNFLFDVFLSRVLESGDPRGYGFCHCRTNERIAEYVNNLLK